MQTQGSASKHGLSLLNPPTFYTLAMLGDWWILYVRGLLAIMTLCFMAWAFGLAALMLLEAFSQLAT